MKGDFSRSTFRKKKHYRKVKMQQGRVQVDADWNEQIDIQDYYDRTSLQDIIGKSGYPKELGTSFEIITDDSNQDPGYRIRKGHYYVEGILIENEEDIEASKQPDLPLDRDKKNEAFPTGTGYYIAYLDVWERHLTALDDAEIQESALGDADTATRSKIVWQVKLHGPVDSNPPDGPNQELDCKSLDKPWKAFVASKSSAGVLHARSSRQEITTNDPCILSPSAGYRGLDNQLYRVEIHDGEEITDSPEGNGNKQVTFKWSRDNGIVTTKITNIPPDDNKLTVSGSGRDKLLGFASGQWVEIIDDRNELLCTPGTLVHLTGVNEGVNKNDENDLIYDPDSVKGQVPLTSKNFPQELNPKVRRWDTHTNSKTGNIEVKIIADNNADYIQLGEDGVEVKFGIQSDESRTGTFRTGDYWLIPARTATRTAKTGPDVEWPSAFLPPEGIEHHFAPLAVLYYDESHRKITFKSECREPFSSITSLPTSTNGFKVNSDLIEATDTTVQDEKFKIIGPYFHGVSDVNGVPPAIILSETNAAATDPAGDKKKINYMEDIVLLSMLNRQYDNHLSEEENGPHRSSLVEHPGLQQFFKTDGSTVPVFFKAVSIDGKKFYILLINYNKSQTVGDWSNVWESRATQQDGLNKIVVGSSKERLSEVFAIRMTDQRVYRLGRNGTATAWNSNWIPLPSSEKINQVVVGSNKNGSFVVFVINSDDLVKYNFQQQWDDPGSYQGDWIQFRNVDGTGKKAKQIAVGTNKDDSLELFAIEKITNKVFYIFQKKANFSANVSNDWSEWKPLVTPQNDDTVAIESIVVSSNKDGRLEVFAIDSIVIDSSNPANNDRKILRHIWQSMPDGSSAWSSWHTLVSGMSLEKIAVGTNKDGRLEVFAIEKNTNKIYHIWQNEPNTENWNSGWTVLGNGMTAKEIAVGTNKDGRLEVFAINKDDTNKIYHIWQNEPNTENWNSGWTVLGNGMTAKEIAVQVNGTKEDDGRLEVFAIKEDSNQVHYIRQNMLTSESSKKLNLRWWAIPANNVPQG